MDKATFSEEFNRKLDLIACEKSMDWMKSWPCFKLLNDRMLIDIMSNVKFYVSVAWLFWNPYLTFTIYGTI